MLVALALTTTLWKPVTISYYSGGKQTADGTKMNNSGMWIATRRYKLGTICEVKVGEVTLRLVVRDKPAKRYGDRFDLPINTWKKFGRPTSNGLLKGSERKIK